MISGGCVVGATVLTAMRPPEEVSALVDWRSIRGVSVPVGPTVFSGWCPGPGSGSMMSFSNDVAGDSKDGEKHEQAGVPGDFSLVCGECAEDSDEVPELKTVVEKSSTAAPALAGREPTPVVLSSSYFSNEGSQAMPLGVDPRWAQGGPGQAHRYRYVSAVNALWRS